MLLDCKFSSTLKTSKILLAGHCADARWKVVPVDLRQLRGIRVKMLALQSAGAQKMREEAQDAGLDVYRAHAQSL
eukprot:3756095-Amphidinium_carterae.1